MPQQFFGYFFVYFSLFFIFLFKLSRSRWKKNRDHTQTFMHKNLLHHCGLGLSHSRHSQHSIWLVQTVVQALRQQQQQTYSKKLKNYSHITTTNIQPKKNRITYCHTKTTNIQPKNNRITYSPNNNTIMPNNNTITYSQTTTQSTAPSLWTGSVSQPPLPALHLHTAHTVQTVVQALRNSNNKHTAKKKQITLTYSQT